MNYFIFISIVLINLPFARADEFRFFRLFTGGYERVTSKNHLLFAGDYALDDKIYYIRANENNEMDFLRSLSLIINKNDYYSYNREVDITNARLMGIGAGGLSPIVTIGSNDLATLSGARIRVSTNGVAQAGSGIKLSVDIMPIGLPYKEYVYECMAWNQQSEMYEVTGTVSVERYESRPGNCERYKDTLDKTRQIDPARWEGYFKFQKCETDDSLLHPQLLADDLNVKSVTDLIERISPRQLPTKTRCLYTSDILKTSKFGVWNPGGIRRIYPSLYNAELWVYISDTGVFADLLYTPIRPDISMRLKAEHILGQLPQNSMADEDVEIQTKVILGMLRDIVGTVVQVEDPQARKLQLSNVVSARRQAILNELRTLDEKLQDESVNMFTVLNVSATLHRAYYLIDSAFGFQPSDPNYLAKVLGLPETEVQRYLIAKEALMPKKIVQRESPKPAVSENAKPNGQGTTGEIEKD